MKWLKISAGHYQSGKYIIRQAKWRGSPDGWIISTEDDSWHDSSRLLANAKRRCEYHSKVKV